MNAHRRNGVRVQVLDSSLEAHVMRSDNSSLAKDCRKDIKAANARLLKLGRKVCTTCSALRHICRGSKHLVVQLLPGTGFGCTLVIQTQVANMGLGLLVITSGA